jgi:subtilisin-like proprotein convertase family protein
MKAGAMLVAVATAGVLATAAAPAAAIRANAPAGARPQLDVRGGDRTPVPADVRDARDALARRLGSEAHVSTDPVGGGVRVLDRTNGFLSGPHAGDPADVALAYVRAHADVFGMSDADLAALRLVDRSTSNDGVTHLAWIPQSAGVPAYDSELRVHVARDGSVVAASGPPLGGLAIPSPAPQLTASQALAAAQNDVGAPAALPRAATRAGAQRVTTFANGDGARLVAFDAPGGDRLAWRVTVAGQDPYWFDEVVDASSGAILARRSLTDFAVSNASVYDFFPGAASGGSAHTVDIARWLSPSATTLTGPNAHAYADVNNNNAADAGEEIPPSSGTDWNYPASFFTGRCPFCTWDESSFATEATNRSQATTQVFYFVNNFHDWLAQPDIGFTRADGNFETEDPVRAEADDSAAAASPSVNNANMSTFPDGTSPRMQMYLFEGVWPDVNGGDDASVVYHEYTHGLSNRLIDDANGLNEQQGQAMGEGWSDWYAMDYLVSQGLVTGQVVVGAYVTGNAVHGIRNQPLDCAVGSAAPACAGSSTAGSGGFTFADLGRVGFYDPSTPRFEVHDDGEIWSETLWDLRSALGASTARRLITEAMRLSPAEPTFLDERDAILLADETVAGGSHRAAIWSVFAARGMGYGARTSGPNATRGVASFVMPHVAEPAAVTLSDPAPGGDADGVLEPGETLQLAVSLVDPGPADLTNVHATLSSATAGVAIPSATASYGAIAAGASGAADAPFQLTVPRSLVCGTQVSFTLHVTSDEGAADLPVVLSSGSGRTTFSSTDVPKTIVDGARTSTSAVSSLNVPSSGRVDTLRVTVDVTHPFVGDLHARLTAPGGQTIDLLERPGLSDDGFGSAALWNGPVTFDDAAGTPIQQIPRLLGSLSGPYAPDEPLAALAGQDRAGTWTLRVTDNATPDRGTLNGWSIETDEPGCTLLPLPPVADGGSGGGGGTPPPSGGSGGGGGGAVTSVASVGGLARTATLNARNAFAVAFVATPGLRGTIRFAIPKHGRTKAIAFGRRSFTVPKSGRVRLTTTLAGRALAQLRKRHTIRVTVTIALGGRPFTRTLTLKAPPPRRRHRR